MSGRGDDVDKQIAIFERERRADLAEYVDPAKAAAEQAAEAKAAEVETMRAELPSFAATQIDAADDAVRVPPD